MPVSEARTREGMLQVRGDAMPWRLLFVFVVLGVSVSCSQESAELELLKDLPIPEGAKDVRKIQVGASPSNQQLFFQVERKYPAKDVFDLYNGHFSQNKWIACKAGLGWKDGWDSFVDESTKPSQRVHRITSFWIRPDHRAHAFVSGMYYSAASAAAAPDNSIQRWIILVQKDVDASAEAKRLSFQCGR